MIAFQRLLLSGTLASIFLLTDARAQDIPLSRKGFVDVYYCYGKSSVAPADKSFTMKFGDPDNLHYGLPDRDALSNASAIVLRFRAWTILGELVTHPTLYWTINKQFIHGRKHRVEYAKISKYPDLVKRYEAIRPSAIRAIVGMGLNPQNTYAGGAYAWFKISDNDVLIYPSGKSPMTFPTAPLNAGEGMIARSEEAPSGQWSFVSNFADFKPVEKPAEYCFPLRQATSAGDHAMIRIGEGQARKNGTSRNQNIWLELKWPLDAIDNIHDLYLQYENGVPPSPLEEADNTLAAESPRTYNGPSEWSEAYEDDLKGVTMYGEKDFYGLKANGRIIASFSRKEYANMQGFNNDGKFFALIGRESATQKYPQFILNKRGVKQTIDGHMEFQSVQQLEDGTVAADALLSPGQFQKKIAVRTFGSGQPQGVYNTLAEARSVIENYDPGQGTFYGSERDYSVDKVQRIILSRDMTVLSSKTMWKIR